MGNPAEQIHHTPYNMALPLFVDKCNCKWIKSMLIANSCAILHTPSPGDKHRQGEGLRGPVQGRRECGTLYARCLEINGR